MASRRKGCKSQHATTNVIPVDKAGPKALAQYRGTKLNRSQKIYPGAGF
jgi:hypothetical protein